MAALLFSIVAALQRHRLSRVATPAHLYRSLSDWSYNLWTLFLLNGLLISLLIYLTTGDKNSAARSAAVTLLARAGTDSWLIMTYAVEQLRTAPDLPVYSKLFFADHIKFQYPTSSLVAFDCSSGSHERPGERCIRCGMHCRGVVCC